MRILSISGSDAGARLDPKRLALGLSMTPALVGLAAATLPALHVGEQAASMVSFGGATVIPIVALAIAASTQGALGLALTIAALSACVLVALAFLHTASLLAALAVDASLVAFAWSVGASLGRRIQHPGHLLPASVVVACADLSSALSPRGPSHAIAASERALSILAVSFPVPGTDAFAPALGVGDLIFVGIVLGAAAVHRLAYVRAAALCLAGTFVAGWASAHFETAVPALVPIAGAVILGLPAARALRPEDRRVAFISMLIALLLAAWTLAARVGS